MPRPVPITTANTGFNSELFIELMQCRCPSPADWAITARGIEPLVPP